MTQGCVGRAKPSTIGSRESHSIDSTRLDQCATNASTPTANAVGQDRGRRRATRCAAATAPRPGRLRTRTEAAGTAPGRTAGRTEVSWPSARDAATVSVWSVSPSWSRMTVLGTQSALTGTSIASTLSVTSTTRVRGADVTIAKPPSDATTTVTGTATATTVRGSSPTGGAAGSCRGILVVRRAGAPGPAPDPSGGGSPERRNEPSTISTRGDKNNIRDNSAGQDSGTRSRHAVSPDRELVWTVTAMARRSDGVRTIVTGRP